MLRINITLLFLLSLFGPQSIRVSAVDRPSPPEQPVSGPGGADRIFDSVSATRYGSRPTGYWIFEPVVESEEDRQVAFPLVIFFHGFTAVDPRTYLEWIEHIVTGGAIVVYPDYQTLNPLTMRPTEYLGNALAGIKDALERMSTAEHLQVDLTNVAVVGHSAGGVLAFNYASVAAASGLPEPSVLIPVQPGGCRGCDAGISSLVGMPLGVAAKVNQDALVLVIVSEDDTIVGTGPGAKIWTSLVDAGHPNADLVMIKTDRHGDPDLVSDHFMPMTGLGGSVDALDWFGPWKLLDLLMSCSFSGLECDDAIGNSQAQAYMGSWSDETPVTTALVRSG
ncbi:alpha/beta hydrolase fold domain-containing protein [soil metagenome]